MHSHLSSIGAIPQIQKKRSVVSFLRGRERVAAWASEMWEAVCSEVCVSFFEGLDRVGEGGRVANFFCSLEAFVT